MTLPPQSWNFNQRQPMHHLNNSFLNSKLCDEQMGYTEDQDISLNSYTYKKISDIQGYCYDIAWKKEQADPKDYVEMVKSFLATAH